MQPLTQQGQQKINEIAQRYGVSPDAILSMLQSLINGNGTMAQFSHPELGGMGQWMQGGMTMVGDMFNNSLKSKVDGICFELSNLLASQPFIPAPPPSQSSNVSLFVPGYSNNWWPAELGMPDGSGAQNNVRYAYFNQKQRLAIEMNGQVSVYNTLNHNIGGVSQQQGGDTTLSFTSQYGTVNLANLPLISGYGTIPPQQNQPYQSFAQQQNQPFVQQQNQQPQSAQEADILTKIEKLADLKQRGFISDAEFSAKKAELLARL